MPDYILITSVRTKKVVLARRQSGSQQVFSEVGTFNDVSTATAVLSKLNEERVMNQLKAVRR